MIDVKKAIVRPKKCNVYFMQASQIEFEIITLSNKDFLVQVHFL